jgi:hypothetical protein
MKTWKERADAVETAQETLELLRQMRGDDTASPEDRQYVLKIQAEFLRFSAFIEEEDEPTIN